MRFIFVSFSPSVFPEISQVANELQTLGHQTVYWLGSSEPTSFIDEAGQTGFIDDNLLLSLVDQTSLDAEDLALLADQEPNIFDFLQRMYPGQDLPELERRYHLLFRYCKWLLEKLNPNVIVFRTTPNLPPVHFILYRLALGRRIKTVIFCDTWASHRVLAMNNFALGVPELEGSNANGLSVSESQLSDDLREYYDLQTGDTQHVAPVYLPDILRSYNFLGRLRAAFGASRQAWRLGLLGKMRRTLVRRAAFGLSSHLSNELPRVYRRLNSPPDFSKPFIYFPLHFQPELSTNPLGGYFRDQLLALELLVASLPTGWQIYVKEHPTQWPLGGNRPTPYRPKDYYGTMARFPSVRLIPVDTDSFKLIRHARAVATISGTAGWEAVLRGKPALVFGYPWYQHAPGVFRVNNLASCSATLEKVAGGETPDVQAVLRFLKRLDEVSFRGCLDLEYRSNPKFFKLTPNQQAKNILESILKNINQ